MFPATAHCVTVAWLESDTPAAATRSLGEDRPDLYLGRADGIAVFYDADTDTPIRAPADRLLVSRC